MPSTPIRWGGFIVAGNRPIILLLALTLAAGFWSTAATECFAFLFLAGVLLQGTSRNEKHRSRRFDPETALQLIFWFLFFAATFVSFLNIPAEATSLPLHMLWHPVLFPAVLLLGVHPGEIRLLAITFLVSGCVAALITLGMYPFSNAEHLEAIFVGDTTFFDLLVLAALTSVCLALTSNNRSWIYLMAGLPAAAAVVFSAQRAPVVIMLGASLVITLAWRPRTAYVWLGLVIVLLLLGPPALWMKLAWFLRGQPLDRYPVWMAGIQLIPSAPMFGYGPGSYNALLPEAARAAFIHRAPTSWHNDMLQTLLENGWLTVVAYTALLVAVLVPAIKGSLRYATSSTAALSAALTLLLFALLLHSAMGLVVSTSVLGTVFWILSALTATIASKDRYHAH